MPSPEFEHAYLLHTRPYRESSLLAEFLVAERGRVGVIMRGRRGKQHALQLFQPLLVSLAGSGELKSLRGGEPAGNLMMLMGNALFSGFYLNELMVRLLPRDLALPEVFAGYALALGELVETTDVEPVLRRFEKQLLDALGYGFEFGVNAETGEPLSPEGYYVFLPEQGFCPTQSAQAYAGHTLLALAAGELGSPEARRIAKQVLRLALMRQLGGRPLKSRELFLSSNRKDGKPNE